MKVRLVNASLNKRLLIMLLFNITSLGPVLFSNDNNIGNADNRNSRINSVIDNTNIFDRYRNFNILLFKEALEINEWKPTLNTSLKESKELQFFKSDSKHHVLISQWHVVMYTDLLEVSNSHNTAVISDYSWLW